MGCKLMEKILKVCLQTWCWKKTLKSHKSNRTTLHAFYLAMG
jgi:hypothetical protein